MHRLFERIASGALVSVPNTDRVLWIGITAKDDKAWQLVAFDPEPGSGTEGEGRKRRGFLYHNNSVTLNQ